MGLLARYTELYLTNVIYLCHGQRRHQESGGAEKR